MSQFIRNPNEGEAPEPAKPKQQTGRSYSPQEILRKKTFWVLYVLDVMMCAGGLVVTAYLAPIAASYNISDVVVFPGATTLAVALVSANVMNGVARPFFGWVSGKIGVWQTMAIAFGLGAVSCFMLYRVGHQPWGLILWTGMVFFIWGEIFSLFPSMCTDLYGPKFATTNTSLLYTAKGTAAFLIPLGALLARATGNWNDLLFVGTAVAIAATILVLVVLRPAVGHRRDDEVLA